MMEKEPILLGWTGGQSSTGDGGLPGHLSLEHSWPVCLVVELFARSFSTL